MSYNEKLAQRLRDALGGFGRLSEKRMMGGLCFLLDDHMVCGINQDRRGADRLMFRVGRQNDARALMRPGASAVELGGRRMPGFIFVKAAACRGPALAAWVEMACGYVAQLPPKPARPQAKTSPSRQSRAATRGRR